MDCFVATLLAMTVFRLFKYRSWLRVIASLAAMFGRSAGESGLYQRRLAITRELRQTIATPQSPRVGDD
jgi:hypothetical protein